MSDYLWDKTGEPEEDVAQLEQLLGALRYEPRPLAIPEELRARQARGHFRPQRSFNWQRLAVAASLLLTLLAGAWLVKSQYNKQTQSASAPMRQRIGAPPSEVAPQQQQTATVNNANALPVPKPAQIATSERVNYRRPPRVFNRDRARRRAPQQELTTRPQEQLATTVMTPEQKAATEQLLLALRIASAKYNYAQREMQEASAAHKPETR